MSPLPIEGSDGPKYDFTSLQQKNRQDIVDRAGNQLSTSAFVSAHQFRLSALGTDMDIEGNWKLISNSPLVSWRHITASGRDQHVKVVYGGYLYPLGHKATLVTITDRVLSPDPVSPSTHANAYLQNRTFIRITEHTKVYPAPGQPYGTRAWPFSSVTIVTEVTPDLDPNLDNNPTVATLPNLLPQHATDYTQAFFPYAEGNPVLFTLHMTDLTGQTFTTQVPLAFITGHDKGGAYPISQYDGSSSGMGIVQDEYNALGQVGGSRPDLVTAPVPGTHLQFAPEVIVKGKPKPGGTTHPTLAIVLGAAGPSIVPSPNPTAKSPDPDYIPPYGSPISMPTLTSLDQPAFYPTVLSANIRLPAAETLSRSHVNDNTGPGGVSIFLFGPYVQKGFTTPKGMAVVKVHPNGMIDPSGSTNPGSVFAGLLNTTGLNFPSDAVGALANPNLGIAGLSAAAGAIGGTLTDYATNALSQITDYFKDITSDQFLGGLTLKDILGSFLDDADSLGVPEIVRNVASDGTITVSYTMKAHLIDDPTGVFVPADSVNGMFQLTATATVSVSGKTTLDVSGSVDPFTIQILGSGPIISIPFGDQASSQPGATFTAGVGKKADIKVNVGQPSFEGALSFVNSLEDFLKNIGGSGVSIDVGPTQIKASISLDLPSVGCGMFNLENMALSAEVLVPFLGDPATATFAFCSQEKPFTLTVMCFGGGGYVLVGVGLTSLQSLTASLDFEGQLGLDLGVASGSVSAMAGITFSYTSGKGSTLTGFVRITGEVEVLGIISITLEVSLTLSYESSTNVATGTATMKISVSIAFFSISVPITVQKSFNGGSNASQHSIVHASGPHNQYDNTSHTTFGDQMGDHISDPLATEWAAYCGAFAG